MRYTLIMALWALSATPVLAQAEVGNKESSDWWKAPNVLEPTPPSEPPSLQSSGDNETLNLLPSDGCLLQANRMNRSSDRNPNGTGGSIPESESPTPASQLPASSRTTNPNPSPAGRGSVLTQAPLPPNTPPAAPIISAPSSPTPVGPASPSHLPRPHMTGAPMRQENPFMTLGPSGPSPLLSYMQCTQCSPCLWAGYEAQQAAATARRMRHVNGQCGCMSGPQYFGNVLGGDCRGRVRLNRYAPHAAIGCNDQCGCQSGCGAGEGASTECGCGASQTPNINVAPAPSSEMQHPQSRNLNGPQRIAVPEIPSGKVANRPMSMGRPF